MLVKKWKDEIKSENLPHEGHRNQATNSTAVSLPELLDLDPLQALDTSPNRPTDLDRQFATFQSLVNEPQAYYELFFVE